MMGNTDVLYYVHLAFLSLSLCTHCLPGTTLQHQNIALLSIPESSQLADQCLVFTLLGVWPIVPLAFFRSRQVVYVLGLGV